ncbi:insulinase family protein [Chitinimonas arctica]|uniref:Insulinase family protein n=1 Tax=Chitinimonas arctica TaxID=2594795 RepID=A0A516SB20_9NEIS|nr:pitrilysin family protein [Chitinimonas arctica]QDQ25345.1 insulinase family protein [Chitinimonas arctica]
MRKNRGPAYPLAVLSLALSLLAPLAATSPGPAAPQPLGQIEGVSAYRLANGLQLFLIEDDSKPVTTLVLNYFVGSRDELYGESGSAHLLEHLMFLGTPSIPAPRDEFRKRGMQQNATTQYDITSYFERFAASDTNLEWALRMEADRMVNATVTAEALAREMTVVRNELERGENSPANLLHQRMQASAYRFNKYREPIIGNRSDVEQVDSVRLRELYRQFYRPDNAALAIAGSFDRDKALAWVERYFGALAKPAHALVRRRSIEPAQDGERSVTLRRPGELPLLFNYYHIPACMHADYPPLAVLSFLVGNGADGRLQKSLIEPRLALGATRHPTALPSPDYSASACRCPGRRIWRAAKAHWPGCWSRSWWPPSTTKPSFGPNPPFSAAITTPSRMPTAWPAWWPTAPSSATGESASTTATGLKRSVRRT